MMLLRRFALALLLITTLPIAVAAEEPRLSFEDARHFLVRTGFMPRHEEVAAFEGLSRVQAVDRLIAGVRTEAKTPPPDWVLMPLPRRPGRSAALEDRKMFRAARRERGYELVGWWYREMAETDSPFTERMTLFWHNHFTSSLKKVRSPTLNYRQIVTLRTHALGNFRQFVRAIAADPAMMMYLDTVKNTKDKPNENFARELLELFTLGEGRYSEQDVKEAARAFTGWSIDRESGRFELRREDHDTGEKTFMGRTGRFDGNAIIDIVFLNPHVAEHVTLKVWREFISETPDAADASRIAAAFRSSGYEIKVLMREVLLSSHFWARENRGRLVRSPVELVAGALRFFRLAQPDERLLRQVGRALGQEILSPPNVKGWPGGTAWITADTLLIRQRLMQHLTGTPSAADMQEATAGEPRMSAPKEKTEADADDDSDDSSAMMGDKAERKKNRKEKSAAAKGQRNLDRRLRSGMHGLDLEVWVETLPPRYKQPAMLTALLLPTAPLHPVKEENGLGELARELLLDPAFQLK
jgi:uncharacterized protein (DUF1800 family)